jgi:histone demethylase JARID1
MGVIRPSTPRVRGKPGNRRLGEKCEHCNKTEDKDNIVVCESCDLGFHKYCLDPPMATLPDYDWHCPKCLVGTGEYGFEEGGIYSLKVFQEKANNFKQHYFSSRMPFDPILNKHKQPTEDEIEREFWRLVESLTETVEVEYGADIHSTTHGSGFPTIEKNPLNQYSKDPWNLNVLPFHKESLFRHIKTDISGMTVPWLYVGMCFSTFCWHNEDHYTYSANYQHFGATKTWYGIPGKDAHAFEEAMRKAVPELFETQPDLLFQLVTLLPPEQLRKAGVEVYALDQRAGQFVITFPQAYHAGFNHGFNFNEAVNFAPADWEPFGEAGVERLQEFRRQPCFAHDELLLTAASVDSTIKTAKWLAPALERMRDREFHLRAELQRRHHDISPHQHCNVWPSAPAEDVEPQCSLNFVVKDEVLPEEDYQCHHCKAYSFLTQFRCHLSGKVSCLRHIETVDCCTESPIQRLLGPNHTLRYRHSNEELSALVQTVVDKSAVPEVWESKLDNLLQDESRPPLKAMHTLLAEGEKIPYTLRGLDSLSDFVKRCDQWVDEANLYLTRKQQNRRKNEKAWRRQSTKSTKIEEKDSEPQLTLERMQALIEEGENLGFQCTQLEHLHEKLATVNDWRSEAKSFLRNQVVSSDQIEAHLEIGRSFLATMPELTDLENLYHVRKWTEDAVTAQENIKSQSLGQCKAILDRAKELAIPPALPEVAFFNEMVRQGDFWEQKAKEIMAAEVMHYPQLDALHAQVEKLQFPVNPETLAQMDAILTKNREAHRQIVALYEKSQDPDFRKRPLYTDIREVMKTLEDLNSKPQGTIDLERELRRHEDWMRKGKKLFGKANAPLHILEVHMKFVEEKNNFCFDLNDTFRPPVEPASRETSPNEDLEKGGILGEDEKPVFCICRQPENGMMIMCENCREW